MELQDKPGSKEIRRRAWEALAAGAYWPFVGGNLVTGLVSGFAMLVPMMMVMVGIGVALVVTGCFLERAPDWSNGGLPALLAVAAVGSVLLTIPWTYVIGFSAWSGHKMALASADRNFSFNLCVSGWGHGWRMAWTVMVKWTYVTLWYLLLIVPGIVKTFSYAMTPYVQIDHPDWGANRCIEESIRLMRGNRWRYFKLMFSFVGWWLLIALTALFGGGVAAVFFVPYPMTASACFYRELLKEKGPSAAKL